MYYLGVFLLLSMINQVYNVEVCEDPPEIPNGWRSYKNTKIGSKADYYCNSGYESSGLAYVTCTERGWTGLRVNCSIKNCGAPPAIPSARANFTNTTYGSKATYECIIGYRGSGVNNIHCPSSGTWSRTIFNCKMIDCGTPPTIPNALSSYQDTVHNSTVRYSCTIGYNNFGTTQITCSSNGSWTPTSYTCVIIDCGTPLTVSYANSSYSGTTYGSTVSYKCHTGYYGSGDNYVDCPSTGTWPIPSYRCTIRDCGLPPEISNGNRRFSATTYLSNATYNCTPGYFGSGKNHISCQSAGSWSPLLFSCALYDCGPPPPVKNANASYSNTTYGSRVTYDCYAGYIASGADSVECSSTGSWSTPTYECSPKDCGKPKDITLAKVSVIDTTYGSYANYSCIDGYEGPGIVQTVCEESGSWSSPSLNCTIVDCGYPPDVDSTNVTFGNTTYLSRASYICHDGFEGKPPASTVVVCANSGQWEIPDIECRPRDGEPNGDNGESWQIWTIIIIIIAVFLLVLAAGIFCWLRHRPSPPNSLRNANPNGGPNASPGFRNVQAVNSNREETASPRRTNAQAVNPNREKTVSPRRTNAQAVNPNREKTEYEDIDIPKDKKHITHTGPSA